MVIPDKNQNEQMILIIRCVDVFSMSSITENVFETLEVYINLKDFLSCYVKRWCDGFNMKGNQKGVQNN